MTYYDLDWSIEGVADPDVDVVAGDNRKRAAHLTAKNVASIRERLGAAKRTFTIAQESIREKVTGDYLLLGFDTEYQSLQEFYTAEQVKEGRARYEVLSYQFYAINSTGKEWFGIAIPDEGRRLPITEFLVWALSKGASLGETIPSNVVLVGHYTRADIPAFDDAKDQLFWQLDNVRNSLVSLGRPIRVHLQFGEEEDAPSSVISIFVRDTILLAPTGRKSLAELGKLIGLEKMKLGDTAEEDLDAKKQMKNLRALDWDLFEKYAILDAEISARYFKLLNQKISEATGDNKLTAALTSIGMKLLKRDWTERSPPIDVDEIVGRERVEETVYDEKRQTFRNVKSKPYVEELSWFNDFVTETYHGGRNEQLWFGPSFEDDWSDVDLTSAYPTAMALIDKPIWKEIRVTNDLDEMSLDTLGFACVDFEFPDNVRYPTLPVRTQNGIVFPLSGRSYCSAPEIILAKNLGCKLALRHGVIVPTNPDMKVFFPFIKSSIERRANASTALEQGFWKEVTNSCYGKTAQGLRDKRVFNLKIKRSDRVGPSDISNPVYASYITSFVRAVVGEIMNAIPTNKMVFSVTTDGFITNATEFELQEAKRGVVSTKFAEIREKLTGSPEVLSEKHSVKQLLGWRTRGQATLKLGTETDNPIVLARAGIKPPVWATELVEQNDYIVRTFLDRGAESRIEFDIHTSIREMLLHSADLVSKKLSRSISMEFDFKRRLFAVVDAAFEFQGETVAHLAFSTAPWKSVGEFQVVRKFWDDYWAKQKLPNKTVKEFSEFTSHFDQIFSLDVKARTYFRKKDGPLRRLQRDLCSAFKNGEAGFDNYISISAKDFAAALNRCWPGSSGLNTKRTDVEYGKRVAFKSRTTPASKDVVETIQRLHEEFPLADLDSLLAPIDAGINLSKSIIATCPFAGKMIPSLLSR